jgi:hypothetical protein
VEDQGVTSTLSPSYNPIFETFVDPDLPETEQLSGIVAYGLYKIAKREWAADLWKREKRAPTPQELEAYIRTWTDSRLRGAHEQAESVLGAFASSVVESATPSIRESAIRDRIETNLAEFKRSQEGQGRWSIFYSIVSNFIYTILLILIVLALAWNGVDLIGILQKAKPPA